jgi:hypothetical protein
MPVIPQVGLGRSEAELKVNRANTEAFINAALSLITLIPYTRQMLGTGARLVPGPPRPTQKARLIDQFGGFSTAGGRATGGDTGERWEVWDLLPDNGYEKRAKVRRYGEGG